MNQNSPISNFMGLAGKNMFIYRLHAGEFASTHDLKLICKYKTVFYLYRNPIDTMYSYFKYEGFPINKDNIKAKSEFWARHTEKWMFHPSCTQNKVIICFERLISEFQSEFGKLLHFMGLNINQSKIIAVKKSTTKKEIDSLVHVKDPKVINDSTEYHIQRCDFIAQFGELITSCVPEKIMTVLTKDAQDTQTGAVYSLTL